MPALLRLLLLLVLAMPHTTTVAQTGQSIFYTLNKQNGLSDNDILQMIQLRDGRLAIYTERGVNVYDGQRFDFVPLTIAQRSVLPLYNGETHLYLDRDERLWLKHKYAVSCVDLQRLHVVPSPTDSLVAANGGRHVEDLYIDSEHDIWAVSARTLRNLRTAASIEMPRELGPLQDLDVIGDHLYLFFGTGKAVDYLLSQRKIVNIATAYSPEDAALYYRTSLIVRGPGKMFYQTRTSDHETIFLSYNAHTHAFAEIYRSPIILNTLNVTADNTALICSSDGYLLFDLDRGGAPKAFDTVHLPDGSTLSTGLNTIYPDQQKGVWLGTYHDGLLYASSLFNLFDTKAIDIPVTPILTSIYIDGVELQAGKPYQGRTLTDKALPYLDTLHLAHSPKVVAFGFCTMNYVRPRNTYYRYRLDGTAWHTVSADDPSGHVNDRGVLYLPLSNLAPGSHTLQVQASTNPQQWSGTIRTIRLTIPPSPWTWVAWGTGLFLAVFLVMLLLWRRKSSHRGSRGMPQVPTPVLQAACTPTASLPLSIPTAKEATDTTPATQENDEISENTEAVRNTEAERPEFLLRTEAFIRKHIGDSSYGVEELAIDLCMERTGLYKKMTALTGDSPVTFIRNQRLDHAARLLREGRQNVNEIAILCGFSSPSYFTKCFKQRFGMKPSEYLPQ